MWLVVLAALHEGVLNACLFHFDREDFSAELSWSLVAKIHGLYVI